MMVNETGTPWLKAKDFIQTTTEIALRNTTTGLALKKESKAEISELSERGISLKIPKTAAAQGHLVLIDILIKTPGSDKAAQPDLHLSFTAKVLETERFDNDWIVATLQFYQLEESEWRKFLQRCAERQQHVNNLVRKIQE